MNEGGAMHPNPLLIFFGLAIITAVNVGRMMDFTCGICEAVAEGKFVWPVLAVHPSKIPRLEHQ